MPKLWNQHVYGLKVTLTCPDCSEECAWANPFKHYNGDGSTIEERGWEAIRHAYINHRTKGCRVERV